MSNPFTDGDAVPEIAPTFRLQWEQAQDCYVILYPEGMVKLNPSAAEILKHCKGELTVTALIDKLNSQYPEADLAADIQTFLAIAHENGWIQARQPT